MKNSHFILMLSLLLSSACIQEKIYIQSPSFHALVEELDRTKTELGEDNKVLWTSGDEISVFENNISASVYRITSGSAGKAYADFDLVSSVPSGIQTGYNVAIYPSSDGARCAFASGGGFKLSGFTAPSLQSYSESSFSSGVFPMVAISPEGERDLSFRNAFGVLKLQLKGTASIKSLTLKGNDSELLSGPCEVTVYSNGRNPEVTMTGAAASEVVLDCGDEGVALSSGKATPFLIAVPPVGFKKGFTVVVEDVDGGKMTLVTEKENPVGRSSILRMPEIVYSPEPSVSINVSVLESSFDDVKISVELEGYAQYAAKVVPKSEFNAANAVREANWKQVPRQTDSFSYTGSLTSIPSGTASFSLVAGQTYILWVAPYLSGQIRVSEDDLYIKEIAVPGILSGGNSKVVLENTESDYQSLTAVLSSSGASMIAAAFVSASELASLPTDESKADFALNNGVVMSGEQLTITRSSLASGETYTLIAIAVDSQGRYGKVLQHDIATSVIRFNNNVTISLEIRNEFKTLYVRPEVSGDDVEFFYYYIGTASGSVWNRVLGGTRESAEKYMAVEKNSYLIQNTEDTPMIDGQLKFDDVTLGEEYVVAVMALTSDGTVSRLFMEKFTPGLNLDKYIYDTGADKWLKSRPDVKLGKTEMIGDFYYITWTVIPASGTTAYTWCTHPDWMARFPTPEEQIIAILNNGTKVTPGVQDQMPYGDEGFLIYVTWQDEDGNFYAPVSFQTSE